MTPPPETPDQLSLAMKAIWERNLPLTRERLDLLDRTATAAETGSLSPERRTDAVSTAHKLAGSLGMYGYTEGTGLARRIEQDLSGTGPIDPAELRTLTDSLRATLGL